MLRIGLSVSKVKAVFISHEHSDHIFGLRTLSSKYQIPVYTTATTLQQGHLDVEEQLIRLYKSHEVVQVGSIKIKCFPKLHDACDPHSFVVYDNKVCVGVFTDIGKPCEHVIHHFKQCHAVFLESNYDVEMLSNGRYPIFLKRRISGGNGHLSNDDALKLFLEHKPSFLSHLILSHLSQNNNHPNIVSALFNAHAGNTNIVVASRFKETNVMFIESQERHSMTSFSFRGAFRQKAVQLRMF